MKLITVRGRKWTALEERLAASLVYRFLRDHGPATRSQIVEATKLEDQDVLHVIGWMRGKSIDLRVVRGVGKLSLGEEVEPSQIELVIPDAR